MIWLLIAGAVCLICYYKAVQSLSYWKHRGVVYKKGWPVIQNLTQLVLQKVSFVDRIYNLYQEFANERYFGTYEFLRPTLFVNDVDLIKKITVKDYEYFIDHTSIITEDVDPLLGRNLFNLKSQRWRNMRSALSPLFTSSKMKIMFTLVSESAEKFTSHFEKQKPNFFDVDIKDISSRFTNDVIANLAFAYKCNSFEDEHNEFYVWGKELITTVGIRFIAFTLFSVLSKIAKFLNTQMVPSSASKFFRRIVKDTINKREKEGLVRLDMIHLLMETRKGVTVSEDSNVPDAGFAATAESNVLLRSDKKHKLELSDEDITAQAVIFLLGGFETSSSLMSFIAYELAMNEDIQKKLQEEIDETLDSCNGKVTYEAIHQMKYMDMVVSETLRKWPPFIVLDRLCVKDYLIEPDNDFNKPLIIEKGTMVQIPVIGIHRDPKYFTEPDTFDPERFNDENKHNIQQFSFIPFGSGPRNCIASRFALMENKTLIFHLLSKFDIVKFEKTPCPIQTDRKSFNMSPAPGSWLRLKKRIEFA
ncbi:hypothetical protein RN001_013370 [Aquatica leii]|uniref:Cytochrome P450 n=1 Tax=Aquatica leii TaxID=1421715 RepID=A0AAN7PZU0_9COLE|nr:hypothetical protein RN001_013370 [Aquatica leii]